MRKRILLAAILFSNYAYAQENIIVYEEANTSSKNLEKLNLKYLQEDKIEEIKYSKSDYAWFKYEKGWVNTPFIKASKKSDSILKENTSKNQENLKEIKTLKEKEQITALALKEDKVELKAINIKNIENKSFKDYFEYFVTGFVNTNNIRNSKDNLQGSVQLAQEIDDKEVSYGFNIGAIVNKNYALAYNYEKASLNQYDLITQYISLDYMYKLAKITPYVGVSLGYADLKWKKDLLASSTIKDTKVSSSLYGIQAGVIYDISKKVSILGNISYKKYNLSTKLRALPDISELNIDSQSSLGVGLRFRF